MRHRHPGITRRQTLLAFASLFSANQAALAVAEAAEERWVAAQGTDAASYGVGWVAPGQAQPLSGARTGFRCHDILQHPLRKENVLAIARRPGTRGLELDLGSGRELGGFHCASD